MSRATPTLHPASGDTPPPGPSPPLPAEEPAAPTWISPTREGNRHGRPNRGCCGHWYAAWRPGRATAHDHNAGTASTSNASSPADASTVPPPSSCSDQIVLSSRLCRTPHRRLSRMTM